MDENGSNGVDKLELVKFFVKMAHNSKMELPKASDGSNAWVASHADVVFAKYDKDATGEIEADELDDDLVQDFMGPYMKNTNSKPINLGGDLAEQ